MTVGTNKFYVLTDPHDVSTVYRNLASFSFDIFAEELMGTCGCPASAVKNMFQVPPFNETGFPNPSKKHFTNLSHDIHTSQLHPGEKLDDIGTGFVAYFQNSLVLERLTTGYPYINPSTGDNYATSLSRMCSDILVGAAQNVYFGPSLSRIDPGLVRTFIDFDDRSWQLLFQVPYLLSRNTHILKDKIVDALSAYFKISSDQRRGEAWSIGVLEKEMRKLGLANREIALMMMILYWGQVSETFNA